ncbi:MAG TPA: serine/threonine-protein kinase [Gemmatimonadaceae bacterium]|nr:serine/threonine-protein kinase [Gemmatimonadaceae bacterium]
MFCPDCGSWNRADALRCARCDVDLPELAGTPAEIPDEELGVLRRATGSRYRILRRLGAGGMATVYQAVHDRLERPLVVKVLHRQLAREPEMRERFRREAEAAARLVHPHVCAIVDYGETDDVVFLVMPYLAGGSLADRLARERTVPPAASAAIGAQVACALDFAHRRGVVHRDVKPDNILFDEDGHALVTDFGIATARFHARLTGTGRAMGTPHYMSPEQAMGKTVDGRSDLYGLGVVLYEMLVGFPPFDAPESYAVSYKQVHEQPVALDVVEPALPLALTDVVMRCLAKAPGDRYARGNELADALLDALAALPAAPGGEPGVRHARVARGAARAASGSLRP